MKILFLYPNAGAQVAFNFGLAHLAAPLRHAGHEVACWQLCEDLAPLPTREEFIARLRREAPDLVGFSVVTNQWPYARQLAGWAREALEAPLACGGIHATVAAEEILETGLFDYVFLGECEEALAEFVERTARGRSVEDVRNLGLKVDGRVRINPVRPLPDLKALPPKDYDLFDFQRLIDVKKGWVSLMASRGCPFSCTYCFNHFMVGKYRRDLGCSLKDLNYIRHFDVGQIIDEIRYLLTHYRHIRTFIFDDDLFTFDRDYVVEFCKAYRKVSDVPFVVNAHFGFFGPDHARALAEAGCRIVKFGVESGSPRIRREIMNRHMTNEAIIDTLALVRDAGMHSSVFIMIGLPRETREDVMETVRLLGKAEPGRFRWTFFYPYPGTRAYEMSVEGRYVDFGRMASLMNFTDASCLDFGPEHNLFLKKVGRVMPWFVNAHSSLAAAPLYLKRVQAILDLDERRWEAASPKLHRLDEAFSARLARRGLRHYAIKYNPFMGVSSDYFLNEK